MPRRSSMAYQSTALKKISDNRMNVQAKAGYRKAKYTAPTSFPFEDDVVPAVHFGRFPAGTTTTTTTTTTR
jgi:hypothetical protein